MYNTNCQQIEQLRVNMLNNYMHISSYIKLSSAPLHIHVRENTC